MSFLFFDLLLSQSLFDLFSASLSNNFYYLLCDYCIRCVTIPGSLLFFSKPIFSSFYHRFDNFACQICIFQRDNKFFIFFFVFPFLIVVGTKRNNPVSMIPILMMLIWMWMLQQRIYKE